MSNGYFTWRPIYSFDHNSLSNSENEKCFKQTLYRKSKKHFMFNKIFLFENRAVYEVMWKRMVQPDKLQLTM